MTPLDALCAIPFHEADAPARAAVLRRLADTMLFVALDGDDPDVMPPRLRLLDLPEGGAAVLACDDEGRLAAVAGGPVTHAGMPGRVLAGILGPRSVGLLVNPGAPSEMLLDSAALAWLTDALGAAPAEEEAPLGLLGAPAPEMVEALAPALGARLADMAQLATALVLLRAGERHLIAVEGTSEAAQPALAKAIAELLAFLPPLPTPVDVTFADFPLPPSAVILRLEALPPEPPRPKGPPILR